LVVTGEFPGLKAKRRGQPRAVRNAYGHFETLARRLISVLEFSG
jgi:hypothetical protein